MLLAVVAAGCGFTGEPAFEGRRTPDVAPWRDRGAITVCDGALRLGAPDSQPAGFCLDAPPALRSCTRDADCRSRERCTCGGCQVAICDSASECADGQVCTFAEHRCDRTCASDADCAPGEVCPPKRNVCRGTCSTTAGCQGGEVCDRGTCVAGLGAAGGPCGKDADCLDHPVCAVQRVPADLREPAPLWFGSGSAAGPAAGIVLYLERREPSGRASIWRAVSPASLGAEMGLRFRFDPDQPVIAPGAGDGDRAGAPSVLAPAARPGGEAFVLVFADGAGRLRRARSADGLSFVVEAAPLLEAAAPWEAGALDSPALMPDLHGGAGLLLYYASGDRAAVGLAESADGVRFAARSEPVLVPAQLAQLSGPALFRDVDRVAGPFAERAAGDGDQPAAVRLWVAARGRDSGDALKFGMTVPAAPDFSVAEAASVDGRAFVPFPYNPVFCRVVQFLEHHSELEPGLVSVGSDRRLLYYRGASADEARPESLGVAENPSP